MQLSTLIEQAINPVALIACSKTKRFEPCQAQEMYQGALFKKALFFCEIRFPTVYILSAKYGLLKLTDMIEPYDLTLNTMSNQERQKWYEKISKSISDIPPKSRFFFCGEKYHYPFDGIKPLQGLSIGKQLQWFNKELNSISSGFDL